MTERTDVDVDYSQFPRIIEVASPSTEIIVQDIVDTLRLSEASFQGMSELKLLDASGKQDLGGGVFVGLTGEFKDAQLAFEPRTDVAQSGTVTTGSSAPIKDRITFIDTAADFPAAGVVRGSLIVNFDDRSIADIVSLTGNNTLTTKVLKNGISNIFTIGDNYHVFNVIQVNLLGGNQVAVDGNEDTISPILPTAFTQVVRTSSSSATLQELTSIQFSSFQNVIHVDVVNGTTDIAFPAGTRELPVKTIQLATTIGDERGFDTIHILGNINLGIGDELENFTIVGESPIKSNINIQASANIFATELRSATISGILDGGSLISDCVIKDLSFLNGALHKCLLKGTVTLGGDNEAIILDSWDGLPGLVAPIIDMGGSGQALTLVNYTGGIAIRNKTGVDKVTIDVDPGRILLEDTVINGDILVRGIGTLEDNSNGAIVTSNALLSVDTITNAVWSHDLGGVNPTTASEKMNVMHIILQSESVTNPNTGVMTYFADDGVTPILTALIHEDAAKTQLYRGQGIESREKLT